jgi:hypothetical protein
VRTRRRNDPREDRNDLPRAPRRLDGVDLQDDVVTDPFCGGCQLHAWHPHCRALRAEFGYSQRIDVEALRRDGSTTVEADDGEKVPVLLRSWDDLREVDAGYCDCVDLSVTWTDEEHPNGTGDMAAGWRTCPECGGADFEGVHGDYVPSGFKRTMFEVGLATDDDTDPTNE